MSRRPATTFEWKGPFIHVQRLICICGVLMPLGCQSDGSRRSFGETIKERRTAAHRQWDSVRSGVLLQLAEQHLEAGRLEEAEKVLEQAITMSPDEARGYMLATRLRLEQGQLAKARQSIATAATLPGSDAETDYLAGIVAERYGDLETALEHYTAAAVRAPHVADYTLAQAETLVALGKTIDALELLSARVVDFEGNLPLRMLAARVSRMLGLRGPTIDRCLDALRLCEDDPTATAELGLLLAWAGAYEEAIGVLHPLVEKASMGDRVVGLAEPGEPIQVPASVVRGLAQSYLATEQPAEAQWALKMILRRDEKDTAAWCLYARAALKLNDLDSASEALATIHRAAGTTPESLLLAGYVALRRGDNRAAIQAARQALALDDGLEEAHWLIAQAHRASGAGAKQRPTNANAPVCGLNAPTPPDLVGPVPLTSGADPADTELESLHAESRREPHGTISVSVAGGS